MDLWRLSGAAHAGRFDGGYGLEHLGRWNTLGRPLTYCATSPSLCVLEKLVHVGAAELLPDDLFMVRYEAPDRLAMDALDPGDLPPNWARDEAATQALGDRWLDGVSAALLRVPSAIVPLAHTFDCNVIVNHRHQGAAGIRFLEATPFAIDPRLLG